MPDYLGLQLRMLNRGFSALGIRPFFAWTAGGILFALLSVWLFRSTLYAGYLYALMGLSAVARLSETRRNEFLQQCFTSERYRKIRLMENLWVCLPFLVVFMIEKHYILGSLLLILSILLGLFKFKIQSVLRVPTPFGRNPYEFIIGFRKTVVVLGIAWLLAGIAVAVDNFNLGLFAVIMIFILAISYYPKPEPGFYIWIFAMSPQKFLFQKVKTAFSQVSLLLLPVLLLIIPVYPEKITSLLIVLLTAYAFLAGVILAKYAAWPHEMNIITAILMAICLYFPPLLLLLIPYFYVQSINHLARLLR